jgi:hypothetical protein
MGGTGGALGQHNVHRNHHVN